MTKKVRLYNVVFPIWLLWIVPVTWLVVLPANFIIDLAIILIALRLLKIEKPFSHGKNYMENVDIWIYCRFYRCGVHASRCAFIFGIQQ